MEILEPLVSGYGTGLSFSINSCTCLRKKQTLRAYDIRFGYEIVIEMYISA